VTTAARIRVLVATVSIVVLAGMAMPAQAGNSDGGLGGLGGGLGGAVGGVVGGVTGAVGGVVGGATGTVGGVVGGVTGGLSNSVGGITGTSGSYAGTSQSGTLGSSPLHSKALVKLQLNILNIKAGIYVLDSYGNLIRVNAKIADQLIKAHANVYVLSHGKLVGINARVALAGLHAKAKVYVLDRHGNLLKSKAVVALGGLKAKVGAKVGTGGIDLKIGLSIGGKKPGGPGGPGGPGIPGGPGGPGTPGGIGNEIAGLSSHERLELKRKCVSVRSSPASYSRDAVQVCRVLAQLAGL
jgi:hypothetical protein